MSEKANPRRLALLAVLVLAVGAIAVWRLTSGGGAELDEASLTKSEDMNQRFIEAGGSTEPLESEVDEPAPEGKGPQELDD